MTLVADNELLHHKSLPIPATVLHTEKEPPEPDAKYSWLVILGASIILMFSVWLPTTYGISIQEYNPNEFSEASAALISWIGILQAGMICIFGIFGIFVDSLCERFDTRLLCSVGSVIARAALILASLCNSLTGLVFTQGVLFGLGNSALYVPGLTLVPQWFVKHCSPAISIAISSARVGGLWLSVAMRAMIQRLDRHWVLQITGVVIIVVCGACSLLMKVRVKFEWRDKIIDFSVLKDSCILFLFVIALFASSSYYLPFYFMLLFSAVVLYKSQTWGFNTSSILNAACVAGRAVLGALRVQIGSLNALVLVFAGSIVCIMVTWLPFATGARY